MKYEKPFLTYKKQANLLIERGLIADQDRLEKILQAVSYYHLSDYLYPYKQNDNTYLPGTKLEEVWYRYQFDRHLRAVVFVALENVEIAFKSTITYHFSQKYGPFGYNELENFPNIKSREKHNEFLNKLKKETKRSREKFVKHFFKNYSDHHSYLPLWMATEIMSFGTLLSFFRGLDTSLKQKISTLYHIHDKVFESWLTSLNAIRNICAHHGRLWNIIPGYKPLIPENKKNPEWHSPYSIENNRIFAILTILAYLLKSITVEDEWKNSLSELLNKFNKIPLEQMGFKKGWEKFEMWK